MTFLFCLALYIGRYIFCLSLVEVIRICFSLVFSSGFIFGISGWIGDLCKSSMRSGSFKLYLLHIGHSLQHSYRCSYF